MVYISYIWVIFRANVGKYSINGAYGSYHDTQWLIHVILTPTDTVCCPDINIEDVVLSNMIGWVAESTAYTPNIRSVSG